MDKVVHWKDRLNQLGKERTPFFFMIDFEMLDPKVFLLESMGDNIFYDFNGRSNLAHYNRIKSKVDFSCVPYPKEKYQRQFENVISELNYGNSFLLNLAAQHEIKTKASLFDIYSIAKAPYKLYYDNQFVVFSPESFVKINKGIISSFPMKGTIDAAVPNAEKIILEDQKEKAEHNTIVDLIRNDLSMVSKNVRVTDFRYISKIESEKNTLLQVSSEIKGDLPDDYHEKIGDILSKLLPAGSISGAPKNKTVEIIKETEEFPRAYYTGVAGIFDGENLDSFVMIRFIERQGDKIYYKSGGGITAQSNLDSEYDEMIKKVYVPIS